MRKTIYPLLSFTLSAFAFAFIYSQIFEHNTSRFILNYDLNEETIGGWIYQADVFDNSTDKFDYFKIVEFKKFVRPKLDSVRALNQSLEQLQETEKRLNDTSQVIKTTWESQYQKNTKKALEDSTRALELEKKSLESQIAELRSRPNQSSTNDLVIINIKIELSKINVQISEKTLEILKHNIKNPSYYVDSTIRRLDIQYWDSLVFKIRPLLYETEVALRKKEREIIEETITFHDLRKEKVSYFDFLYYSLNTSLGNSFGDIIPNHKIARYLSMFQLFISVVILAWFLNSLWPNRNTNEFKA